MPDQCEQRNLDRICSFLRGIGISVELKALPADTFLPGVRIEHGSLAVDVEKLQYVGDLLHEAGHVACMAPSLRATCFADAGDDQGEEIAAQAWSYAAALAAGVPPEVVFHEQGYKGSANHLVRLYREGGTNGVPLLQWYGLTAMPKLGEPPSANCFPAMQAWIRTMDDPSKRGQKGASA